MSENNKYTKCACANMLIYSLSAWSVYYSTDTAAGLIFGVYICGCMHIHIGPFYIVTIPHIISKFVVSLQSPL